MTGQNRDESPQRPREILVLLWSTGACGRDFLAGYSRYARDRPNWNTRLLHVREAFSADVVHDVENGVYDGIVTDEDTFHENPFLAALTDTPLVVFGECPPDLRDVARGRFAFVQNDDEGIGAFAAERFQALGNFRSYAFVPPNGHHTWAVARQRGFTRRVARLRREAVVFGARGDAPPLAAWLAALPKPAAVMVAWDNRAVEVVETCHVAGIDVPGQVSVIGVDDDELLCNFARPSITSIRPDHEDNGYHAARMLDALFASRKREAPRIVVRSGRTLVERESTASPAPAAHLILGALEYIRRNAMRSIRVSDVVAHLGVSRRLLEQRFRELQGQTVLDTIVETRLEEVSKQILSTRLPVRKIAALCGFRNVSHLERIFRRRYGTTLLQWRRNEKTNRGECPGEG